MERNIFNIMTLVRLQVTLIYSVVCTTRITRINPWSTSIFILYINDQCNVSKALDFIVSADDTNIFYSHKDSDHLMRTTKFRIRKVSRWFQENKLSINVKSRISH